MTSDPFFILEEAKLVRNLELIQRVRQEADVKIIVAFKGFAMWKVFDIVRPYLDGATGSSLHEARLCFEEMKTPAHTYAVVYFPDEFSKIMKYSTHITFNSLNQYEQFYPKVKRRWTMDNARWKKVHRPLSGVHHPSIGLRINPEYSVVETELYNPGKAGSRLGIDIKLLESFEQLAVRNELSSKNSSELIAQSSKLPEGIEGLHVHCLCESSAADTEGLLNTVEEKLGKYFSQIKWLNLGGGHLMTRADYDVEHLIKILKNFRQRYPHLEVILEPGSAVAWDTGYLTSTVMDIVDNHGVKTIITDVSFTAHMPDTLEMPYRPKIRVVSSMLSVINNDEQGVVTNNLQLTINNYHYRIGGTSCLSGDFMEAYEFDSEVKIGDKIIFEDMIHYTMVKTTTFNGVKHPGIGMIKKDGSFEIFRKFGYKDYKNRLS